MNIQEINEAIELLEDSDTTVDNVIELSSLYIVRKNLKSGDMKVISGAEKELNDLFPYYNKYVDAKTRYRFGESNEGEVSNTLKSLCVEVAEFINVLYCNTNMRKERKVIEDMIKQLYEKYDNC